MIMFVGGLLVLMAGIVPSQTPKWYVGDERCPPPRDDGSYSAPYNVMEHQFDYPYFVGADKPGWSCSYRKEDGTIVQYGDSRTPQEQWQSVWGQQTND